MGILNGLFGFRWSLYIVQDRVGLVYAMHENSVIRIVGFVMSHFADGKEPVNPWSLHLNFNKQHESIKLRSSHFTADGQNVTSQLINEIAAIDPGWKVKGGEPVFEVSATKKRLKISNHVEGRIDIEAMLRDINKPSEVTFFNVMNDVFGK